MTSGRDPGASVNYVVQETRRPEHGLGRDPEPQPSRMNPVGVIVMIAIYGAIGYGAWRLYEFFFPL